MIERFRRERQILASLAEPPKYRKARRTAASPKWRAIPVGMEYVEGQTLLEFAAVNKLEINRSAPFLHLKVCSALSYAHRNLVVHRDIKPGNILVDRDGEPKLLDFGLAKLVDESFTADQNKTQSTDRHSSHDQPAVRQPRTAAWRTDLTTASDVYSLGVRHPMTNSFQVRDRFSSTARI